MKIREKYRISILTWNMYLGAELPALFTTMLDQIPNLVTEVFRQFLATNFPARVKVIARQIAQKQPDLIGLQEAVIWQLIIPKVQTVTYDFVQFLLDELKRIGLDYKIAVQNKNTSVELPDSQGNLVRLLDRDIILIRNENNLVVSKRQEANFKNNLIVRVANREIEYLRGWSSIDFQLEEGHRFRVINTHLDTDFDLQALQAIELLDGPANTKLPVILTGDLNSNANTNDTQTYRKLIESGFDDVWRGFSKGPGLTCCQSPDLLNAKSSMTSRIDYILYKNGWIPLSSELVGNKQRDRTSNGLWPSDHAGVFAKLVLKA